MKSLLVLTATLFLTASWIPTDTVTGKDNNFRKVQNPIANRYIVVLNEGPDSLADTATAARDLNLSYPGTIDHVYDGVVRGYSVEMSESTAIMLSKDESVDYVEEDGLVETQSVQTNAPWGISRIDQVQRPEVPDTNYEYSSTGSGVNVYIIDTGVNTQHPDFGGRAVDAANLSSDNTPISQCNGHGTHVAGIVGSSTFGVAKAASIYSVRVFPCWGGTATSDVVAGVDWVSRHAVSPAVANMSVGGNVSSTLDRAVQSSINRGITYVIAAGNYSGNACDLSPGRVPDAITVGMTDERDFKVDISNYGPCVDIFAPGSAIHSTGNMPGYPSEHIMSGTSTASPHVAGVAALYLERNPSSSPAQVASAILSNSTSGILSQIGDGSPNRFLFSNFIAPPSGPGCSGTNYLGVITTPGSAEFQSSSSGFSGRAGSYKGSLSVPAGANFTLALESGKGGRWTQVAVSSGGSQIQSVTYKGKTGTYRWRVQSIANSGTYSLCSLTP